MSTSNSRLIGWKNGKRKRPRRFDGIARRDLIDGAPLIEFVIRTEEVEPSGQGTPSRLVERAGGAQGVTNCPICKSPFAQAQPQHNWSCDKCASSDRSNVLDLPDEVADDIREICEHEARRRKAEFWVAFAWYEVLIPLASAMIGAVVAARMLR